LGGQLKTAKAASRRRKRPAGKKPSRTNDLEEELAGVQKQRDELNGKLAAQQQAAEESKGRSAELENRLRDSHGEAERAKRNWNVWRLS